jgi:hypothetical protein
LPPKRNIKKEHFGQFFNTLGQRFLAGGDYNSKNVLWGSRLTTTKGKELAKLVQDNNYSYISGGTATYWPTDCKTTRPARLLCNKEFLEDIQT